MRDNFLNKVYDTYSIDDFSYGIDNLNPIREVKPSNSKNIDDEIANIYAALAKRVETVKNTVADITGSSEEEAIYTGNSGAETNNGTDNTRRDKIIKQVGGTKNKIIAIPSMEDSDDPLSLELELMLLEMTLQATIGDTSPSNLPPSPTLSPKVKIPDDLPFEVDCDNESNETDSASDSNNNSDDNYDLNYDSGDDNGNNNGNNNSNSSNSSDSSGSNGASDTLSDISDAVQDAQEVAIKASAKNDATMAQCAAAEIGFLKAILAVLKIIKALKKMLDPVLGTIMEAVQIVQLAAQCWNNPTCISVIVQRVMQTIISIIMGVVASLIAQLWAMLGLDCYTAEAQNIMDEIREALAAVGSVVSELNPTGIITDMSTIVGSVKGSAKQAWENAKNSVKDLKSTFENTKDATKQAVKDAIKEQLGLTDEDFENFISNKASRNRVLSALKQTAPKQAAQIESMVDQVLNIQDTVEPIITAIKSMTSTVSASQKLLAQFKGLKVKGKNAEDA